MPHPLSRLEAWRSLADDERLAAGRALAEALGARYEALPELAGSARLPLLRERETGLRLVAVPGGEFEMGLSAAHRDELLRHFRAFEALLRARPAHRVTLPSFLLGQAPLLVEQAERLRPGSGRPWLLADRVPALDDEPAPAGSPPAELAPDEVGALLGALAARLPSEAEWEYAASGAGAQAWLSGPGNYAFASAARAVEALLHAPHFDPSRPVEHPFGLWGLLSSEWVADAWHPSYQGAPSDGSAWEPPPAPESYRGGPAAGYPWQDRTEVLACHVASRAPGPFRGSLALRVARDLPAEFGGRLG